MAFVIINPEYGGLESGKIKNNLIEKNFNLNISRLIYNKLKDLGIDTYLLRDSDTTIDLQERLNLINRLKKTDEENILITNALSSGNSSGAEIVYGLKNDDSLAREITNELEANGYNVLKYYQLRNPSNTSLDFYPIIREVDNVESIIVNYGYIDNPNDYNYLINDEKNLAESVARGIYNYIKKENVYTVLKNDTLYSIARKFNTTVSKLKEINNLVNNIVNPGQTLIIPKEEKEITSPNEYINYTVKSGDSLYKIANNFNTTVNAIKDLNNLTSNNLQINQVLKIPTPSNTIENSYINYTVKSGDSLYKIASNFNTTVDDIKRLNNLTSNNLQINQVLKIPASKKEETIDYINYTVKSGDSLYKIASLYNTSVAEIKDLNNLTSNNLQINQVLKIPKK